MDQLSSASDLRRLRASLIERQERDRPTIVICAETCCQAAGANDVIRRVKKRMLAEGLLDRISIRITGCHGLCEMGPVVLTEPGNAFYVKVKGSSADELVDSVLSGRVVEDLLLQDAWTGDRYGQRDEIPFFKKQVRSILGSNQWIDPIKVTDYIRQGGYRALEEVVSRPDPEAIVEEVKRSGLRGRGGAGFPTGLKWELARKQGHAHARYVIANADEGDPGAYMDRSILEGNPHSVLEGMAIGAIAIGAHQGYVFVRNEYPQAIKHTLIAIRQARELGLLGKGILGTQIDFDVSLVSSAGAFVCGEETALIRSIEGKMGEPRQRPPFPVEKGLWGCPTCINNVETWANVPRILLQGGEAYARVGTGKSTGTKIFSVVGKVKYSGLVEVPMGTTIREVLHEIGGGPRDGGRFKAVQIGGPSGGCVPADLFDLPIDYDSLAAAGFILGSGGMIAMDERTCMVDVARYFLGFLMDESCGKCFTCRKGIQRMHEILGDIAGGDATLASLDLLEELAGAVRDTTMCGLGHTAPNPVLTTLRYFRSEYEEHIVNRRCPAGVCRDLISYSINDACNGCGVCRRNCPEDAIAGAKRERHAIEAGRCIRCGVCKSVCEFAAVEVN